MKLTKEELDIIEGLKKNKDNFLIELGQIKYNEILLNERNENALSFLQKLKEQEVSVMKSLEDKYGKGTVNVETGEFTPE
jgi:hypothetical protein